MKIIRILTLALCFASAPALADAGADGSSSDDAGVVGDVGEYPDTGCADGLCCVVLPNWDVSFFDAGVVDTGQRRRRPRADDTACDCEARPRKN